MITVILPFWDMMNHGKEYNVYTTSVEGYKDNLYLKYCNDLPALLWGIVVLELQEGFGSKPYSRVLVVNPIVGFW